MPPRPSRCGQPVTAVADQPAVAPHLRRIRHTAASRLGVGRALSALLCAISPRRRFCPRCARCCYGLRRATLQPPRERSGPDGSARDRCGTDRPSNPLPVPSCKFRVPVVRPCNASATLLARTVTERAPRLTCQCPRADLAGNSTIDHDVRHRRQRRGLRGTQNMSQDGAQGRYAGRAVAGGRYQLRDLLGEGGMASVHLAYDSRARPPGRDQDAAHRAGPRAVLPRALPPRGPVRRQAHAHQHRLGLRHRRGRVDGTTTPYIVMEYVEGRRSAPCSTRTSGSTARCPPTRR